MIWMLRSPSLVYDMDKKLLAFSDYLLSSFDDGHRPFVMAKSATTK